MLVIDFSQTCMACLAMQGNTSTVDVPLARRMVLGSLRKSRNMFRSYGEVVLAADHDLYWRRAVFPHYKANRRKKPDGEGRDPEEIHRCIRELAHEFGENLPYSVVRVEGCEADDVIGTLVGWITSNRPDEGVVIVSADHDFIQLHRDGVRQYDHIKKKGFIEHPDPDAYMLEHCMRGDPGDGIPNVLSAADSFVTGTRQTPLTKKRLAELVTAPEHIHTITEAIFRRMEQNATLIDLTCTPSVLQDDIVREWQRPRHNNRDRVLSYFSKYRLNSLIPEVNDFL